MRDLRNILKCTRGGLRELKVSRTLILRVVSKLLFALLVLNTINARAYWQKQTQRTQESDAIDFYWGNTPKYYITIGASTYSTSEANLPFAAQDSVEMANSLEKLGYHCLGSLAAEGVTRDAIVMLLKQVESLPQNALLSVYFSGHGETDERGGDLWLQCYGQPVLGDYHGIAVSEIIHIIRENRFSGQLSIILDTCYSGRSAALTSITLKDIGENTTIFASSTSSQLSFSVTINDRKSSAFTHVITRALTTDWARADENADGILLFTELKLYSKNELSALAAAGAIGDVMEPVLLTNSSEMFIGYDSKMAKNRASAARDSITSDLLEAKQVEAIRRLAASKPLSGASRTPVHTPETKSIALQISDQANAYTKALQAIEEERFDTARELLDAAERQRVAPIYKILAARGRVEVYQSRFEEALQWYLRAVQADEVDSDTFLEAGSVFMINGDIVHGTQYLEKGVILGQRDGSLDAEDIGNAEDVLFLMRLFSTPSEDIDGDIARAFESRPSMADASRPVGFVLLMILAMRKAESGNSDDAAILFQRLEHAAETIDVEDELWTGMMLSQIAISERFGSVGRARELLQGLTDSWKKKCYEHGESAIGCLGFLGWLYQLQRRNMEAEELFGKQIGEYEKRYGSDSVLLAPLLNNRAISRNELGRASDAQADYERALEIVERAFSPIGPMTVPIRMNYADFLKQQHRFTDAVDQYESILAIEAAHEASIFNRIDTQLDLADVYIAAERNREAVALLRQSIRDFKVRDGNSEDFVLLNRKLASALASLGSLEAAEQAANRAVELAAQISNDRCMCKLYAYDELLAIRLRRDGPEAVRPVVDRLLEKIKLIPASEQPAALVWISGKYEAVHDYQLAATCALQALSIAETEFGCEDYLLINPLMRLGYLAGAIRYDAPSAVQRLDGRGYFSRAHDLATKYYGDRSIESARSLIYAVTSGSSDIDEIERTLRRSLEICKAIYPTANPEIAFYLYRVAAYFQDREIYSKAADYYRQAVDADSAYYGSRHREVGVDLLALGTVLVEADRLPDAVRALRRARDIFEDDITAQDLDRARVYSELGAALARMENYSAAEESLMMASRLMAKHEGGDYYEIGRVYYWLGQVRSSRKDYQSAADWYYKALSLFVPRYGSDGEWTLFTRVDLAGCLARLGRYAESEEQLLLVIRIQEQSKVSYPYAVDLARLGFVLSKQGKVAEAMGIMARSVELMRNKSIATDCDLRRVLNWYAEVLVSSKLEDKAKAVRQEAVRIRGKCKTELW